MPMAAWKGSFSKDSFNQIPQKIGSLSVIHSIPYSRAICAGHVEIYSLKFTGLGDSQRIVQEIKFYDNRGLTLPYFLQTASSSR